MNSPAVEALSGLSDRAVIALHRAVKAEIATAEQRRDFELETGWQADAYPDRFAEWVKKQEEKPNVVVFHERHY